MRWLDDILATLGAASVSVGVLLLLGAGWALVAGGVLLICGAVAVGRGAAA